jgi:predicted anti-sigma-YlaC factor YlaD
VLVATVLPVSAAQLVHAGSTGDREQPCPCLWFAAELAQCFGGAEESFLREIFGSRFVDEGGAQLPDVRVSCCDELLQLTLAPEAGGQRDSGEVVHREGCKSELGRPKGVWCLPRGTGCQRRATNGAVDCDAAREAISALLDGEPAEVERGELKAHLAACAACRSWREDAHEVTRRARLSAAIVRPPAQSLLAGLPRAASRPRWWRSVLPVRAGLVVVAAAQLAVTVPALLLGSDHDAPIHVAHEMGSFDMALAVGFLVAAWRPSRALGMRALVGAAALLLILTAAIDLLAGRTSAGDEAPHLIAVAGWLLLCRLSTLTPSSGEPQARSRWHWRSRRDRADRSAAQAQVGELRRHVASAAPAGDTGGQRAVGGG